jgi:large subunit ribosomal protein L6
VSRVGKLPIPIPAGVKTSLDGSTLTVTGPKGSLTQTFLPEVGFEISDSEIVVTRPSDKKDHRAIHGLTRALVSNMVTGVSNGFEKTLQIQGVGYRVALAGKTLNLQLGYSHPVTVDPPEGISFAVDGTTTIKISGIDRQAVGQVAADIRKLRKPEPYKGKGIRYENEKVRRKVGKAGGK